MTELSDRFVIAKNWGSHKIPCAHAPLSYTQEA